MLVSLRRSITVKILVGIILVVSAVIFAQTYWTNSNIHRLSSALIQSSLKSAMLRAEYEFNNTQRQVFEDSQLIRSHDAINNYIDYISLEDEAGANGELVKLELFLSSLVKAKPDYKTIELYINGKAFLKIENALVVSTENDSVEVLSYGSNKTSSVDSGYSQLSLFGDKVLLTQLSHFVLIPEADLYPVSSVSVAISRDINTIVNKTIDDLSRSNIHVRAEDTNGIALFASSDFDFNDGSWLVYESQNNKVDTQFTLAIAKQNAYFLSNEVKRSGLVLGISLILVMGLSMYIMIRKIISRPLQQLNSFVDREIIENRELNKRYPIHTIDEIGVFSQGLNSLLDAINHRESSLKESEKRLNTAMWGGCEGIWEFVIPDKRVIINSANPNGVLLQLSKSPLSLAEFVMYVHEEDRISVLTYSRSFIPEVGKYFYLEFRLKDDEIYKWFLFKGRVTSEVNGDIYSILGVITDITVEKEAQEKIRLFATAFESSASAIMILDENFAVLAVNKAYTHITGFVLEDIEKHKPRFMEDHKTSLFNLEEFKWQIAKKGRWTGELVGSHKEGNSFLKEIEIDIILGSDHKLSHYICVFSDVTEKRQYQQNLIKMANKDTLTGLANRAYFRQSLDKIIAQSKVSKESFALLFVDLDRFKQVNDSFGHEMGDAVLCAVGALFNRLVRKNDLIARLGGDEFAIILQETTTKDVLEEICQDIIDGIVSGDFFPDKDTGIGVSIGISLYPTDADTSEELIHSADTAMYFSKTHGRNQFSFYSESMSQRINRRNLLEKELRIALMEDKLSLHYQPQICLKTKTVIGFEALSRWSHSTLGDIAPDEFISIAEDSGLIVELGNNALLKACEHLVSLHALGYSDLRMAVNVSAKQFLLSDIYEDLNKVLEKTSLPACFIELELTESLLVEDPERVISVLGKLKTLGVRIAIDDFGTGYSSLSYLSKFPIDILKIDRSFVSKITLDDKMHALTESIIAIAHILDLEVVAEGVETNEQQDQLVKLDAEFAQGWLYSKAIRADKVVEFLKFFD